MLIVVQSVAGYSLGVHNRLLLDKLFRGCLSLKLTGKYVGAPLLRVRDIISIQHFSETLTCINSTWMGDCMRGSWW